MVLQIGTWRLIVQKLPISGKTGKFLLFDHVINTFLRR